MRKKNLEKKVVCAGALISGLNQSKEEIGLSHTTYLHPCMKRLSYLIKEEIGLLKKYSKNERTSHKIKYGG